jgi:peroxiredoxin family protein
MDLSGLSQEVWAQRLDALNQMGMEGNEIELRCQDPSFNQVLIRWCGQSGHEVVRLQTAPVLEARVRVGPGAGQAAASPQSAALARVEEDSRCTLLVLHNDFEALMAALMTATAAAAGGMKVEIFFSFWGVNMLRADKPQDIAAQDKPTFLQRVFAWMMPRGPRRQQLGKLNFGGMGTNIMLGIMRQKKVMDLDQLMQSAIEQDVRFVVCTTSMSIMGLDKRDIAPLPNVHFGGVASFVDASRGAGMSLVF